MTQIQPSLAEQKPSFAERTMMNPLIRKLTKVTEVSEDHATYSGIGGKCLTFMAALLVGIVLAFVLQQINGIALDVDGEITNVSPSFLVAGLVALVFFVLTPIIAFLIRPAIPVVGMLYCLSTGYILSFISVLIPEYQGLVLLAAVITVAIVAVMALMYAKGWVKVNDKFRTVIKTLFFASVASGVLMLICYFIPGLKNVVMSLQSNWLLNLIGAVAYVVIAALMLLVDFDTIQRTVERKLPRKYEWVAAFGLTFSVIWLFLKVLSLLLNAKDGNSE